MSVFWGCAANPNCDAPAAPGVLSRPPAGVMATLSNEAVVHVSLFPDETDNPTNAFVLIQTVIVLPNWVQTTSSGM